MSTLDQIEECKRKIIHARSVIKDAEDLVKFQQGRLSVLEDLQNKSSRINPTTITGFRDTVLPYVAKSGKKRKYKVKRYKGLYNQNQFAKKVGCSPGLLASYHKQGVLVAKSNGIDDSRYYSEEDIKKYHTARSWVRDEMLKKMKAKAKTRVWPKKRTAPSNKPFDGSVE